MSAVAKLKELSELLTDSQKGFAEAEERIEDPRAKQVLRKIGNGRAPLIEEIGNELAKMGEGTPDSGTTKGAIHRTWISLRETISKSSDPDVIAECSRGEEYLVERYRSMIESDDMPLPIKDVLMAHCIILDKSLHEIEPLRILIK